MNKKKIFTTRNIVIIALFAAISYVSLYFKIPIPSPVGKPFLHLGNLVVILAALLFGGTIGGLSGAIGMTLFDILNGWVDTSLKTFILKLGIGIFVGLIFSRYNKDDEKKPTIWLYVWSAFFLIIGAVAMYISKVTGGEITIISMNKALTLPPVLYIFSIIMGIILLLTAIFSQKMPSVIQYVILAGVAGIVFNLAGEFVFGIIFKMLAGSGFYPALIASAISLPATLINGVFSIIGAALLYLPIARRMKNN